jgi:hypothetical protein
VVTGQRPSDFCPLLSDPADATRQDALETTALADVGDTCAAQTEINVCLPADAALFGLKMRRLVEAAIREIEVGDGTAGNWG